MQRLLSEPRPFSSYMLIKLFAFNFATLPKCYVVILFQIFTNCYSFTIAIYFDQIKNKQFISNELTKFEQIKQTFNSLNQKQLETGNLIELFCTK